MLRPRVRELGPCGQLTRGLVLWRNTRPAPPSRRVHPASELSGHGGESTLYGELLYFVLHLFQIVFLNATVFSVVMTCEGVSSYVGPFRAQAERQSHELLRTSAPGPWVCGCGSAAPSWTSSTPGTGRAPFQASAVDPSTSKTYHVEGQESFASRRPAASSGRRCRGG